MRPLLGIVDPLNTDSCPREVHISSGLDVLFHALESWTAIPYTERVPRPQNPLMRPAYQGAFLPSPVGFAARSTELAGAGLLTPHPARTGRNPISDVFSEWALRQTVKYLPRVARDGGDREAKSQMLCVPFLARLHELVRLRQTNRALTLRCPLLEQPRVDVRWHWLREWFAWTRLSWPRSFCSRPETCS